MNPTSWGEIEDLLLAAHQRTAEEYEQFVQRRCADPVLRETITTLVKRTGQSSDTVTSISAGEGVSLLVTGTSVGPYVVLHRLGRGGMGEVFLARDSRLDRSVALKYLVSSAGAPQELRDRVVREARLAARINHPHVAAVHDVIEHDNRTFMVMEYVDGESLGALLKRGPLPPERVIELGRQIAAALAAAHRAGVVHRDLKPTNVQVTPDGSVKVLDFGIATAFAGLPASTAQTGRAPEPVPVMVRAGTPGYMSPEQILGREVDERSDVFSLSIVLFEMAMGHRPVESREPIDFLLATIRGLPRAEGLERRIPEALSDVIAKGLSSDPRARFQSAAEMGRALEAILPRGNQAGSLWRRILRPVGLAALVPVLVWGLGRISSAGYNTTLERTGVFATERTVDYLIWGTRSMVAPLVYAALAIIVLWAVRFAMRLVALWSPAERRLAAVLRWTRAVAERLSLSDPVMLAQALAGLGLVALAGVAWRFNELIVAWGTRVSSDAVDGATLLPLIPDNENERVLYRAVLTVLLLVFSAGLLRVLQLRARIDTRRGGGALLALGAIVVSLLLLIEVPYRIFFKNQAPRAEFQGMRCYAIGEHDTRLLLYCPDAPPPRNKIVNRADPAVRLTGDVESIFTPPARKDSR